MALANALVVCPEEQASLEPGDEATRSCWGTGLGAD